MRREKTTEGCGCVRRHLKSWPCIDWLLGGHPVSGVCGREGVVRPSRPSRVEVEEFVGLAAFKTKGKACVITLSESEERTAADSDDRLSWGNHNHSHPSSIGSAGQHQHGAAVVINAVSSKCTD